MRDERGRTVPKATTVSSKPFFLSRSLAPVRASVAGREGQPGGILRGFRTKEMKREVWRDERIGRERESDFGKAPFH